MIRRGGVVVLRAALIAAAIGTLLAASVVAVDPTDAPSVGGGASRASCAERYPADGPGGVDLQLGCLVNELVTTYTGGAATTDPPRISAYLGPLALTLVGVAVLVSIAVIVRRATGRRLAPIASTAFWSCPGCRSLNPAGSLACYRCRRRWTPEATDVRTDGEALAPQSFGRRADRP